MNETIYFQNGEMQVKYAVVNNGEIKAVGIFKDHIGYRWEAVANFKLNLSSDYLFSLQTTELCRIASTLANRGEAELKLGKGV